MQVCAFCLQHSDCYCCCCCRETKESTLSQPQTRHKCWCVHVFMNQKRCSKSNYLPCTAHNRAPIGIESRETRGVNFSAKKVLNCLLFPSLYSAHPRFVCWTIDWLIFACWSNQVWVCVCAIAQQLNKKCLFLLQRLLFEITVVTLKSARWRVVGRIFHFLKKHFFLEKTKNHFSQLFYSILSFKTKILTTDKKGKSCIKNIKR